MSGQDMPSWGTCSAATHLRPAALHGVCCMSLHAWHGQGCTAASTELNELACVRGRFMRPPFPVLQGVPHPSLIPQCYGSSAEEQAVHGELRADLASAHLQWLLLAVVRASTYALPSSRTRRTGLRHVVFCQG